MDQLHAFEHGWQNATGSIWAQSQGSGQFCDAFDDQGEEEVPSFEAIKESLATRRVRTGQFKAVDTSTSIVIPPVLSDTVGVEPCALPTTPHANTYATRLGESAWEEEAKRRKQLWRGLIGKYPGYGHFWEHLSRVCTSGVT